MKVDPAKLKSEGDDQPECHCSDRHAAVACRSCGREVPYDYWCETCQQLVADKRCPGCGLKARKVRPSQPMPKARAA